MLTDRRISNQNKTASTDLWECHMNVHIPVVIIIHSAAKTEHMKVLS